MSRFADDETLDYIAKIERDLAAARQREVELASEAAEDVESWGAYASEYFQEKHGLADDVKKWRDRALAGAQNAPSAPAADTVKVPEPVGKVKHTFIGEQKARWYKPLDNGTKLYSPEVLDLLQAETVAKEKAEAERDALRDRLNSMESLYVSTIKPGDWIEP